MSAQETMPVNPFLKNFPDYTGVVSQGFRDLTEYSHAMGRVALNTGLRVADRLVYSMPDTKVEEMAYKIPMLAIGDNPTSLYDHVASLVDGPEGFVNPGKYIRYLREYNKHRFIIDYYPKGMGLPFGTEVKQVVFSHPKRGRFATYWRPDISSYKSDPEFRSRHPHKRIEEIVELDRHLSDKDHENRFMSKPTVEKRSEEAYRELVLDRYTRPRDNLMLVRSLDGRLAGLVTALKSSGRQGVFELAVEVDSVSRGEHIAPLSWIDMAEILARKNAKEMVIEFTSENENIRKVMDGLRKVDGHRAMWPKMKREMEGSCWSYTVPIQHS